MKNASTFFSFSLLIGALCMWGIFGYLSWRVTDMQNTRAALISSVEQSAARQGVAARTHAILQETAAERLALLQLSHVDILTAVNAIEAVGPLAGVKLSVSGARPGQGIPGRAGVPVLHPINFTVQAEGTFANMMRAIALLETLELPVTIEALDIGRAPLSAQSVTTTSQWHINVNLRLLTTADISS